MAKLEKPKKPYAEFPLTAHPHGTWCKKIKGKLYHFGKWADWKAAKAKYDEEVHHIQAGRVPVKTVVENTTVEVGITGEYTVGDLCSRFMLAKLSRLDSKELAERSYNVYLAACDDLAKRLGKTRLLTDIKAETLEALRGELSKGVGLVTLANKIRLIRVVLNFAYDRELVKTSFRFKGVFEGPSKSNLQAEKNAKQQLTPDQPLRMFQAADIRLILANASTQLRAMTLIGINCGFGQNDLSLLPENAVDLARGWINFPRPKTAVQRQCPLWPETVEAIRRVIAGRTPQAIENADGRLFVTRHGNSYVRLTENGGNRDSIAMEFGKLLKKLKIKRHGLNAYALRHTFETIGGDSLDQIAVDFIMGHAPRSDDMAEKYRRLVNGTRLKVVTEFVRLWLWSDGSEVAWLAADEVRKKVEADAVKLDEVATGRTPSKKKLVV
jgi:integrase